MTARIFKPDNRLAQVLSLTKGLTTQQALGAAADRLEYVREASLGEVDRAVQEIARLSGQVTSPDDPAAQEVYAAANRVLALAGVFGLSELGEVAFSLCELITRLRAKGQWNAPMVMVHVDALYVMRSPDDHAPERRDALRTGLGRILEAALA